MIRRGQTASEAMKCTIMLYPAVAAVTIHERACRKFHSRGVAFDGRMVVIDRQG